MKLYSITKSIFYLTIFWLLLARSCSFQPAYAANDTPILVANNAYHQLNLDTSGVEDCPRTLALKYAMDGLYQVGIDVGVPFTKSITTTSLKPGVLIDTGLIWISSVAVDSAIFGGMFSVRGLTQYETKDKLLSDCIYPEKPPSTGISPSGFWWHPGSDSIVIGPVSLGVDTLTVTGYKEDIYSADSTTATNLESKCRWAAVLWACYLASQSLENGRVAEFEKAYLRQIAEIWQKRVTGMPYGSAKK